MPERPSGKPRPSRTVVLDTAAILAGLGPAQGGSGAASEVRFVAPERLQEEVRPGGPTGRSMERQVAAGLAFRTPPAAALATVEDTARTTGDLERLSMTDRDVLAVAYAAQAAGDAAEVWSDDLALQNVARRLGIGIRSVTGREIRDEVVWYVRCTGCGRYVGEATREGDCPVCGSPLKRTRKAPGHVRGAP